MVLTNHKKRITKTEAFCFNNRGGTNQILKA